MFEQTKILTVSENRTVKVQRVDSIKLAGRPLLQVRISPDLQPEEICASLRQIADFIDHNSPEGQCQAHQEDTAA